MRTAAAQLGLLVLAPFNAAMTLVALARARPAAPPPSGKTVMVSGGKMTKALQLCRSFSLAGHRVILVETAKYRLTGHRFSRAVDAFHVVPEPGGPGYAEALLDIVRREHVDVFVPVDSPAASQFDADARTLLDGVCEVVHGDADTVRMLDDKFAFSETAASLGLAVPEHHRITAPEQVAQIAGGPFVLKSIPYDPVNRLDLTPDPAGRPISEDTPWILQGRVDGKEYCTHSTVRDGRVQLHACCESSAFQLNYAHVEKPEIEAWVRAFVGALGVTGQLSFDFIEEADGTAYAIECNPRTHSAITMFHDDPRVAGAYLSDSGETVLPRPDSRPTYWLYHELWRLLTEPHRVATLRRIVRGRDAIFAWDDPLPFFVEHHVQIPWLLAHSKDWIRIDFNIGKLVEPGGD